MLGPAGLASTGPIIPVELSIPDELARFFSEKNMPIPAPITGNALIDTGASITAVDLTLIQQLGINPVGVSTVFTPQGQAAQELFPIKLAFPGTTIILSLNAVLGSELRNQNIVALIGRNILARCILVYNGPLGNISLSI